MRLKVDNRRSGVQGLLLRLKRDAVRGCQRGTRLCLRRGLGSEACRSQAGWDAPSEQGAEVRQGRQGQCNQQGAALLLLGMTHRRRPFTHAPPHSGVPIPRRERPYPAASVGSHRPMRERWLAAAAGCPRQATSLHRAPAQSRIACTYSHHSAAHYRDHCARPAARGRWPTVKSSRCSIRLASGSSPCFTPT